MKSLSIQNRLITLFCCFAMASHTIVLFQSLGTSASFLEFNKDSFRKAWVGSNSPSEKKLTSRSVGDLPNRSDKTENAVVNKLETFNKSQVDSGLAEQSAEPAENGSVLGSTRLLEKHLVRPIRTPCGVGG